MSAVLHDIVVTLDSHAHVGIERPTFWQCADGSAVALFTTIVADDVARGRDATS